ncbi:MAG TPA: L-histidine N(alpha)-methyltransferase [Pseudomonadota bacterium]|nr:L-histidine N(alpha)-methyltransferase [Pseudomonadota bacterium]
MTPETEKEAVRAGLRRPLPEVSPHYFYDDVGSDLFERITQLDVYYPTRTEISILEAESAAILERSNCQHLVELGSGAGRKIRLLLDAWGTALQGGTCTMLDINELFLRQSIARLASDYPAVAFRSVVGNFVHDLDRLGQPGRRMIVFFAGTIGNLYPHERHDFLCQVAASMDESDRFLVGIDLVKDPARIEAAYNDPEGITAAFNRNILSVINRRFAGNFDPFAFAHRAFFDADNSWIEMRLRALRPTEIRLHGLDLNLAFDEGSEIRTEISCKFTHEGFAKEAEAAGLRVDRCFTDLEELFSLVLLRKGIGK